MIWWAKSRRLPLAALAVGALLPLVLLWPAKVLPLPSFDPASPGVPAVVPLPAVMAAAVVAAMAGGAPALEACAVRSTAVLNRLWALAVLGCCTIVLALAAAPGVGSPMWIAVRNLAGFLGLGLLAGLFNRAAAPISVIVYLVIVSLLGDGRSPQFWAWPLAAPGASWSACLAVVLLVAGLVFGCAPTRQSAVRDIGGRETFE